MSRHNQAGFAVVEAVLIVVVVGLLIGVGVFVVSKNGDKKETANQTQQTSQSSQSTQAPSAQINAELESAAALEATTIDDSTTEIDKSVDAAIDSAASVGESYNENEL